MARPCKFYNPATRGGCRRGSECTFLHSDVPAEHGRSNENMPVRASHPAHSNICKFFLNSGSCNRDNCRFLHTLNLASARDRTEPAKNIIPFLTEEGLAKITGVGSDAYFQPKNQSYFKVRGGLKPFLLPGFEFKRTSQVYDFVGLLYSASSSDPSWSTVEGQLLLDSLADPNGQGIARFTSILTWRMVSLTSRQDVLSFQRGYLPLLKYLSSDYVIQSILSHRRNGLYSLLVQNIDHFADIIESCLEDGIHRSKSFKDPSVPYIPPPSSTQVLKTLIVVLTECATLFKNSVATYPRLRPLVLKLGGWTEEWAKAVNDDPSHLEDDLTKAPESTRRHITKHITAAMNKLLAVVDREEQSIQRSRKQRTASTAVNQSSSAVISALEITYEGPGEIRRSGPRHDNDFVDIQEIRIAPTHEELMSDVEPFIPANIYGAPHPSPIQSMERLMDIQFRLLREELTAPIRQSVKLIVNDLEKPARPKTRLSELLEKKGGKYRGQVDNNNSIMFNVYTNVTFASIVPDRRGMSVSLSFDTPPGRARSTGVKARRDFWESVSGKRLMQGGLIAMIWKTGSQTAVHLGIVASSSRDLVESASSNPSRVEIKVVFFDSEVDMRIFQMLTVANSQRAETKFLVEAPVMFEAIRPFLEALRVEPEIVPFGDYLVHRPAGDLETVDIAPPAYALTPGFSFQLASLFPPEAGIEDLTLDLKPETASPTAETIRETLSERSRLDPSQANAVVDALTREIVLIQGPPGTGKSYTGVELLRVLIKNNVRPILMIAFTNHALDHMLRSVLDANITKKIVRLGSRSKDEVVSKFTLETLERISEGSKLNVLSRFQYRELKIVEEQIVKLLKNLAKTRVSSEEVMEHLNIRYDRHYEDLSNPPPWVEILHKAMKFDDGQGAWTRVDSKGQSEEVEDSLWAFWRGGEDLKFLQKPDPVSGVEEQEVNITSSVETRSHPNSNNAFNVLQQEADEENDSDEGTEEREEEEEEDEEDKQIEDLPVEERWQDVSSIEDTVDSEISSSSTDSLSTPVPAESAPTAPDLTENNDVLNPADLRIDDFFNSLGYHQAPLVPCSNRSIEQLLDEGEMWSLSIEERARLSSYWIAEMKRLSREIEIQEFDSLRLKHADVLEKHNNTTNEARRQILQNVDIIGCTTTGAAKLTSLLNGISPKVMLVEEAGQVLEAHVLGNLVKGVEHLILIGDPLQLRPTIQNYALSMDNRKGGALFKFDMSLMERLATAGLPMSRIDVQRRMRPSISSLIRNTLYPGLQDHDLVKEYPPVKGMAKDVFFFTHNHRERGGEDDSASKYNVFEVDMIADLVMYLLRQGTYSDEGDIVVLCAYLGQLAKLRDALMSKVTIVIDEKDQGDLAEREEEKDEVEVNPQLQHVKVTQRVRLRTIDNYQGEEARIVILSLVRNGGDPDDVDNLSGPRPHGSSIGFLKSANRTNVALSRAKEGLYILGNAATLSSQSEMWRSVIEELEDNDAVGEGFPIQCDRHPQEAHLVSKPGELPRWAPDGGCLQPCDFRLSCGHMCPFKCHSDDPRHLTVRCLQPCTRLCSRRHPCPKLCNDSCGECHFSVSNITLPCGHNKAHLDCFRLDDLDDIFCNVPVEKELPGCGHRATLCCSQDPATWQCKTICNGIMSCCGRNCNAQCHECRRLSDEQTAHRCHPCQKPLFCGHRCGKTCSPDHECNLECQEPCRQACSHARCRSKCSSPCAPCQEPCIWNCAHHECPVPCGSICARLPCDERCEKILSCGHRCPSVCGENCAIQICPTCATLEQKETTVDLVLGRTLADVQPDKEELEELMITLPNCGHVFTVETLDGVCQLGNFYSQNKDGKWCSLRSPGNDFLSPPACPTCRSPVTSPRYGRVFKRADLDILEWNVALRMSCGLTKVNSSLNSVKIPSLKLDLAKAAGNVEVPKEDHSPKVLKTAKQAQVKLLNKGRDMPLPYESVQPGNTTYHHISPFDTKEWKKAVRPLFNAYTLVIHLAETRTSQLHAWEAAFSCLAKKELDKAAADPLRAPRNPNEHAMRMAAILVGQPRPLADTRFRVEIFWATIQIRFMLVELGQEWLKAISKREKYRKKHRLLWATYISFVLESCLQDAQIAYDISSSSGSRRQMATTRLLIMRAELEKFSFNVTMSQETNRMDRDSLLESAKKKIDAVQDTMKDTVQNSDDQEWLSVNFVQTTTKLLEKWRDIEKTIRSGVFYQEMTREEMFFVVQGIGLSTGHFYRCPNGHTFVIGECGGAMQISRCPECNAQIGGNNHALLEGNARDTEYEEIVAANHFR